VPFDTNSFEYWAINGSSQPFQTSKTTEYLGNMAKMGQKAPYKQDLGFW
jgi:hypothetical protein